MEICYLSFWIKTNMQSMQMHKLQINETQTRKLMIQNLHQGCGSGNFWIASGLIA